MGPHYRRLIEETEFLPNKRQTAEEVKAQALEDGARYPSVSVFKLFPEFDACWFYATNDDQMDGSFDTSSQALKAGLSALKTDSKPNEVNDRDQKET